MAEPDPVSTPNARAPLGAGPANPRVWRRPRFVKKDRRGVLYIIVGAVVFHALFFAMLMSPRETLLPKSKPVPEVPTNFGKAEEQFTDSATGETLVVREFTVSTQLFTTDAPNPRQEARPVAPVKAPLEIERASPVKPDLIPPSDTLPGSVNNSSSRYQVIP